MSLFAPNDPRPVHFVGLSGAGMSGLAELLVRRGVQVTGCDANPSVESEHDLGRLGLKVLAGHDAAHVRGCRALVVTSAIPKDHPELEAARMAGIPIVRRAEALAEATRDGDVVAIAGTTSLDHLAENFAARTLVLPQDTLDEVDALTRLALDHGMDTFIFWPQEAPLEQLRRFAEEVAPLVREAVEQERASRPAG